MTMGHISGFTPGLLPLYYLCFVLIYLVFAEDQLTVEMNKTSLGEDATLTCKTPSNLNLTWEFQGKPINSSERTNITEIENTSDPKWKTSTLLISNTTKDDHGNYTCVGAGADRNETAHLSLDLTFPGKFVPEEEPYRIDATAYDGNKSVDLKCIFEMYYAPEFVEWQHEKSDEPIKKNVESINATHIVSTYTIKSVSYNQHDGNYTCRALDKATGDIINGTVRLIVYGLPTVKLDHVLGIGPDRIYLNWTVDPANSEITRYDIWVYSGKEASLQEKGEWNATSYIIKKLKPKSKYGVRLEVVTKHGNNSKQANRRDTETLAEDPVFIPNISINGFSATSVTIGWHAPPPEIAKFFHYYLLEAWDKNKNETRTAYHSRDSRNLPYMFDSLEPHRTYIFKARACSDYTKECGNWSEPMAAATMDGIPGKPSNVHYNCTSSLMYISWDPPKDRKAEIKGYTLELTGYSEYTDKNGKTKKDTWGPLSRFKSNDSSWARFDDLQPNTRYTARLSAMTRSRRRGEEEVVSCSTAPDLPDSPLRPRWRKILENDKYLFKMFLPKVSERNGPLCCYRVHVVRLPANMDMKSLKQQSQMEIIDYEEAHGVQPVLGAYIADIFTNANYPKDSEIVIGDEHELFNRSDSTFSKPGCARCLHRPPRPTPDPHPALKVAPTTTTEDDLLEEGVTDEPKRERRSIDARPTDTERDYGNLPMMMDTVKALTEERDEVKVRDGRLDSQANYTVYVELIPFASLSEGGAPLEPIFSDYLNQLRPAPSPVAPAPATALEIALQATCAIAALVLLLMIIFCVMQTRRSRKLPPHAHLEMGRLPPVFRFFWPTLGGRSALVPTTPPDMPAIACADLPAAYSERHADCDLGFQKEFELLQLLSECFPDRSTHASEARENQSKNRYPDIKAYDQTRVKLSQIDGITGSDYINANYVMGYKERKKFICAQGPTDTTVNDFWRMVWEHGLELVVMLTNLEEYSKVKCSKYWPDDARERAFGAISVRRVQETRYSDYIVRELKISKLPTNAEGQPIVENNGVKRNGDIGKQDSSEASAPTSPRETPNERTVRQYHFLMWKDFAAPEHPHSILKFIKRVNEAWSSMLGRPVVVHCSAGVGRTGTLVALDCLLDQLRTTGQVSVFNTIAELRRQRNFLVQSQKQYVFVYRALVEYAHYGDTEIPASRLKSSIDRLRNTPEGADKCLMEHEFEKMINSPVAEPVKSCAAAQAEEVRSKNRSAECLPYDRNRVMLTPIPGRDYSTYINASFIEAYDNSEGFIITQDPLPATIFDFWRMVSEQSVSTVVMLSELGEGKCPRYWDDGTAQYEHLSVQYDESECCPYYTRRQFRITNTKTGHTASVRQLQYQGWPTAPGHVPEVTRGLGELADAAALPDAPDQPPMLVHCSTGTERSALFVALCILIVQLRTERRVDVQAVARKVRSQRSNTIDTVLQYEFLHRAILNYAELHNLLEDS